MPRTTLSGGKNRIQHYQPHKNTISRKHTISYPCKNKSNNYNNFTYRTVTLREQVWHAPSKNVVCLLEESKPSPSGKLFLPKVIAKIISEYASEVYQQRYIVSSVTSLLGPVYLFAVYEYGHFCFDMYDAIESPVNLKPPDGYVLINENKSIWAPPTRLLIEIPIFA